MPNYQRFTGCLDHLYASCQVTSHRQGGGFCTHKNICPDLYKKKMIHPRSETNLTVSPGVWVAVNASVGHNAHTAQNKQ